ncbi:dihydrofolate reductase [Alkalibacterium kapii]|uniref:Dihydrofolate reductase n=1 Tax=Alkalibacterium kapii TaxID=426704 RepID=A0A511B190_9LACT|nr:dihydrofolate reductase [Alkalibacterium kapii]GEK91587.1 dihydrofolate reductase [Alkalibacterium kapii]
MITFVWAEDENGLIGSKGNLPWHLPADMQFFKKVTLTGDVVMGRKTLESIPNPPLKNRKNIVLTSKHDLDFKEGVICHSKKEIMEEVKHSKKPLHVIGGVSLFKLFIDDVDMLYRTVIHDSFEGETYMPEIDYSEFELIEEEEGTVDVKNKYPHTFQIFKRK